MTVLQLLRRLVASAAAALLSSVVVFAVFFVIPGGDPAQRIAGPQATPAVIQQVSRSYGFDKPLVEQYLTMMHKLLTNQLVSYANQTHVVSEIFTLLPTTLALAVGAIVIGITLAVGAGLTGAYFDGRWPAVAASGLAMVLVSAPGVFLASTLQHEVGQRLQLVPDSGYVSLRSDPRASLLHLALPCFVLSLGILAYSSKLLRAVLVEEHAKPYIKTARAKGVPERKIWLGHLLGNAILPVFTTWGLEFAALVGGGTILVESIFDIGGVGQYAAQAVSTLDLPVLIGVSLLGAVLVITINFIVDLTYGFLDPRAEVRS